MGRIESNQTTKTTLCSFQGVHCLYKKARIDPESFARGGPTLTAYFCCFYHDEKERIQITNYTEKGTSSASQRNVI